VAWQGKVWIARQSRIGPPSSGTGSGRCARRRSPAGTPPPSFAPGTRDVHHGIPPPTFDATGDAHHATPNGVRTVYTYDSRSRPVRIVTGDGTATVASYSYTLGPTGVRTRIEEADSTVRAYAYDALDRLAAETVTGPGTPNYTKTFHYDAAGNRIAQVTSGAGAASLTYTYDRRDRLITDGTVAYSWDDNGNLVGKSGNTTYQWDFDDRLVQVERADGTTVRNEYDPDGVLVRSTKRPFRVWPARVAAT
jgi:YD repeat-containing protein